MLNVIESWRQEILGKRKGTSIRQKTTYTILSITSEKDLERILSENGIDLSLWGNGGTKTVDDLFEELKQGESILEINSEGILIRKLVVGHAKIYYIDNNKVYILSEEKQISADGKVKIRNRSHISEKTKVGESAKDAIIRGIKEELGVNLPFTIHSVGHIEEINNSLSFPGLKSKYILYRFLVYLGCEQYKPEGYIEKQEKKTVYFKWTEAA